MDAAEVVRRSGGLATRQELLEHVTARELVVALHAGQVVRVVRGRYALPVMHEAKVAAVRVGGVISHLTAALLWGWPVKTPPQQPTVTVPRGRNLSSGRGEGIDVRYASLSRKELDGGVTTQVRTVIDCARVLPFDDALAVADSALRSGVSHRALLEAALESPRTGRGAVLRVIRAADRRAMNPFESVLRALAIEAGLTVVPQLRCADHLHVDVGCADLRLAIEAESWAYHGDRQAFCNDVRRYTLLVRLRWIVARFLWEDVMFHQARVRTEISEIAEWCAQLRQLGRMRPRSA